ncbi:hypothetical protein [Pseudorhodoplanes sp.]|uniref:hypothetical protein n=1 Tax=Pseudorhodoplanes sp. TaxID=1934341 RepID=UPI003D098721
MSGHQNKQDAKLKFERIATKFNVRKDSIRAATLKRLSVGPAELSTKEEAALPYLRRRGRVAGYEIVLADNGRYALKAKRKAI